LENLIKEGIVGEFPTMGGPNSYNFSPKGRKFVVDIGFVDKFADKDKS